MPAPITEVDTFTSTVLVPTGGDARTAASVLTPLQALANRTRNLLNRLAGVEQLANLAVFQFESAGLVGNAATLAITELADVKSNYSVSSNLITVPAAGTYEFTISGYFANASAPGAANICGAVLRKAGVNTTVIPSVSAGNSGYFNFVWTDLIMIADAVTDTLGLRSVVSSGNVQYLADSRLKIRRVA
jgi:hypothetical protein